MRDRLLLGLLALTVAVGVTVLGFTALGSTSATALDPVPEVVEPAPPDLVEITTDEPFRLGRLAPKRPPFPDYEPAVGFVGLEPRGSSLAGDVPVAVA
jgi:hypothetical protein